KNVIPPLPRAWLVQKHVHRMASPAHLLHGLPVSFGRACVSSRRGRNRCGKQRDRERASDRGNHFVFAATVRLASLASTALGMPSPNWLTVRISLPLENSISSSFSLCIC